MSLRTATITTIAISLAWPATAQTIDSPTQSHSQSRSQQSQNSLVLASRLIEHEIVDESDTEIGEIQDLVVDQRGRIGGAVVSLTWLDDQLAILPLRAFQVMPRAENEISVRLPRDTARQAKTFPEDNWDDVTSGWMIRSAQRQRGEGASEFDMPEVMTEGAHPRPDVETAPRTQRDDTYASSQWTRLTDLMDYDVVSSFDDDDIGDVEDLIIDTNDGRVRAAIVSNGGFLGIGEDLYAVDWRSLQSSTQEEELIADMSEDDLENMQTFTRDQNLIRSVDQAERQSGRTGQMGQTGQMDRGGSGERPQSEDVWVVEVFDLYAVPTSGFRTPRFDLDREQVELPLQLREGDHFEFVVQAYDLSGTEQGSDGWSPSSWQQTGDSAQQRFEGGNVPYRAEYALDVRNVDRDGGAVLDVDVCWCEGWATCGVASQSGGMQHMGSDMGGVDRNATQDHENKRQLRVRLDPNGRIEDMQFGAPTNGDFVPAHKSVAEVQLAAIVGSGLHRQTLRPGETVRPRIEASGSSEQDQQQQQQQQQQSGRQSDQQLGQQNDQQPLGGQIGARYRGTRTVAGNKVAHFDLMPPRQQSSRGYDQQPWDDGSMRQDEQRGMTRRSSDEQQEQQQQDRQSSRQGTRGSQQSAGFATYRVNDGLLQSLIVHPGMMHRGGSSDAQAVLVIERVSGMDQSGGEQSGSAFQGGRGH